VRVAIGAQDHLKEMLFYLGIPTELYEFLIRMLVSFLSIFSSLQWLFGSLNVIFEILFSIFKIFSILLIFFFVLILARRIFKTEGIVIMPFETPNGEGQSNYNGKAISDLLTVELQRILRLHSLKYEEISIKPEKMSTLKIVPQGETLEFGISDMGNIGTASTSLSLGRLIIIFKRLCPGGGPTPIITGSVQIYGKIIMITARLERKDISTWEVRRKIKWNAKPEEHIPSMIRDLSFKIVQDLHKEGTK
jgi:hypothetical protein